MNWRAYQREKCCTALSSKVSSHFFPIGCKERYLICQSDMPVGAHIPPVVPESSLSLGKRRGWHYKKCTFITPVHYKRVLSDSRIGRNVHFKAFISPTPRRVCSDSKVNRRIGMLTLPRHLAGMQARPCHLARE